MKLPELKATCLVVQAAPTPKSRGIISTVAEASAVA